MGLEVEYPVYVPVYLSLELGQPVQPAGQVMLLKLHGGPAVYSRLSQRDDLRTAPVRDAGTQVADAAATVHTVKVQLLVGRKSRRLDFRFPFLEKRKVKPPVVT